MTRSPRPSPCPVCDQLEPRARRDLDLLMGDPARWPSSVWGVFDAPNGPEVPPKMREWGAVEVGQAWLAEHGYIDVGKTGVREHYERHVPLVPTTPEQLLAAGILASGGSEEEAAHIVDPLAYLRYYMKGLEVGQKGLELLLTYVDTRQKAKQEVPVGLIKMMVDVGAKLAVSQAQIKAREKSQPQIDDSDEDFRGGDRGIPSPRMGHHRIRDVGGERQPIHDEGPKDRATYNARAAKEGSPSL